MTHRTGLLSFVHRATRAAVLAASAVLFAGCSADKPKEEASVNVALAQYVLDEVPSDVPNPTFIDFGGKVHLVGWSIEPKEKVGPGERFKLTLYWKSVSRLEKGWRLFTHLVAPGGTRLANPDDVGALRASLQPSDWQPGKVYVDVQDLEMPRQVWTPEVSVTVGIWRDNARLDVISGPSDNERRAIVTHVKTGVVPPKEEAPGQRPTAGAAAGRPVAPAMPGLPGQRVRPVVPPPGMPAPGGPAPAAPAPAAPGADPHAGHDHP